MTEEIKGQMSIFDFLDRDTWSGKTYPARLVRETRRAKTSESSLKKQSESSKKMPLFLDLRKRGGTTLVASWETPGPLLGEFMTHSFGESPKDAVESRLSQILVEQAHPKYYLSAKACLGILNRAEKKGKKLPVELQQALEMQAKGA